ncbi:hypothetical protein LTR66_013911 [Elasticomyces elasticus]|nr:hypothetical protein LTR66_013911 [Elasticomyces elasticus]
MSPGEDACSDDHPHYERALGPGSTVPAQSIALASLTEIATSVYCPLSPASLSPPERSTERTSKQLKSNDLVAYYQSLPSPPNFAAYEPYDPEFGKSVRDAFKLSLFQHRARKHKYGEEVAKRYHLGWTPDEVRAEYGEKQKRAMERMAESTTEEESETEEVTKVQQLPRKRKVNWEDDDGHRKRRKYGDTSDATAEAGRTANVRESDESRSVESDKAAFRSLKSLPTETSSRHAALQPELEDDSTTKSLFHVELQMQTVYSMTSDVAKRYCHVILISHNVNRGVTDQVG